MSKQAKQVEVTPDYLAEWNEPRILQFQDDLVHWYSQRKRDLPWRLNQDPYRIWVSEIMLQQTQVITVIPYFERFMEWFPTIKDFAEAPEERILKAWEGLGYYSRVRNMQKAAQTIVSDHQGEMPTNVADISELKGIGPYTTGAIASIAFDIPEPAIDGNVMRVYSRLFEVSDDIAKPSSRKTFDKLVRATISQTDPSSFNQGLMDLGATICKPTSPLCEECPVREYCASLAKNTVGQYPVKSKKVKARPVYYQAQVIRNQKGELLIEQRPSEGLLANLWQFPLVEVSADEYKKDWSSEALAYDLVAEPEQAYLSDVINQVVWLEKPVGEVTHIFSHLKWFIQVTFGVVKDAEELCLKENQRWVKPIEVDSYPLPKPQTKMLELLKKENII
ncbi:A/G-specific adenine glycosylase [Vagococcus coleopterorum]|uniref:Adenine DNA glycosylase n=1 Tax=Vagococcus coleopterorum TaxID=2714946 RepID=A0A6G8AKX2_9ENTE|nr:A/G-specific adenine glycosylase [Vagococcus coleopterorum]QIL45637.1 A/G-specific adenine glycosylase [Vagococcus coleopterorum]